MKLKVLILLGAFASSVYGQDTQQAFFSDFSPRSATIPPCDSTFTQPTGTVTTVVTADMSDFAGLVSKYLYGNSCNQYSGDYTNATLRKYIRMLSPNIIRFPGGSNSNGYFWNNSVTDVSFIQSELPDTLFDSDGNPYYMDPSWWWFGKNTNWQMNLSDYYNLREAMQCQGLITINYGYARYGQGPTPAITAAKYAADWVRYDAGRTKFWEIGNENGGPWEQGYRIDTKYNNDGQPALQTGALYGKHFKIFADSMRKAAEEIGATIYIGAQVLPNDATNSWNITDRTWNSGFFAEAGDYADFFVIHNYFGFNSTPHTPTTALVTPKTYFTNSTDFLSSNTNANNVENKVAALTEWNMDYADNGADGLNRHLSCISGMQAVIAVAEAAKNHWGMACRWNFSNGESGMFYADEPGKPWNPYPDFFYLYYMQRFFGDSLMNSSVTGSSNVYAYVSKFASGQAGVVIVNLGAQDEVVSVKLENFGHGRRYYMYNLTKGTDAEDYPLTVYVNGYGSGSIPHGGPIDQVDTLKAMSKLLNEPIIVSSPKFSTQFLLVENGYNYKLGVKSIVETHATIFPNPASDHFTICLEKTGFKKFEIHDMSGRTVYTGKMDPAQKTVEVNCSLQPGIYMVSVNADNEIATTKLIIQ
jgi:hypothetical protein